MRSLHVGHDYNPCAETSILPRFTYMNNERNILVGRRNKAVKQKHKYTVILYILNSFVKKGSKDLKLDNLTRIDGPYTTLK